MVENFANVEEIAEWTSDQCHPTGDGMFLQVRVALKMVDSAFKMMDSFIKNDEFCIKNDEFCITNDGWDRFCRPKTLALL